MPREVRGQSVVVRPSARGGSVVSTATPACKQLRSIGSTVQSVRDELGRDRIRVGKVVARRTARARPEIVVSLRGEGSPAEIHIVCALACTVGIEYIMRAEPRAIMWCGDIDDELTAKGYIVPGLGDAGDLAYGVKVQM